MEQADKELLLKDLCARLPYGIKVNEDIQGDFTLIGLTKERAFTTCEVEGKFNDFPIELIKPYLFPLSSMTETQQEEFDRIYADDMQVVACNLKNKLDGKPYETNFGHYRHIDWLNKNHFDYRGLIEKSLALDATNLGIYE